MKTSQKDLIYWSIITIMLLIGFSVSMYSLGDVTYSSQIKDSDLNETAGKLTSQKEESSEGFDVNGETINAASESISTEFDNSGESKIDVETAQTENDEVMEGEDFPDEGEDIYLEKDLDEEVSSQEGVDLEVLSDDDVEF